MYRIAWPSLRTATKIFLQQVVQARILLIKNKLPVKKYRETKTKQAKNYRDSTNYMKSNYISINYASDQQLGDIISA